MDTTAYTSFGELLKAFRKRRRLRQEELAARLGVHRNTIGAWERGDRLPDTRGMIQEAAHHLRLDEQETRQLLEASLLATSLRWNVPSSRNPFFTGREELLQELQRTLNQDQTTARSRSYALHGLGGIGKTQIAVEFAYRYAHSYSAIFWVRAETQESILSSFASIAALLELPEQQDQDQTKLVAAVLRWLNTHRGWLLIFDNVEDLELISSSLPTSQHGSLLYTTRLQTVGDLAHSREVEPMTLQEGTTLLLKRAKLLQEQTPGHSSTFDEQEVAARKIVEAMQGLPLALDQAGAYLEETRCSPGDYLRLFQEYAFSLLDTREASTAHPLPVTKTFLLSFARLREKDPAAAELLTACAFLAPDALPEKLFTEHGAAHLGPLLAPVLTSALRWNTTLKNLLAFSLLRRNGQTHLLSIHRLVQVVLRESLTEEQQRTWIERVMQMLNNAFPLDDPVLPRVEQWSWCETLLPHVFTCYRLRSPVEATQTTPPLLLEKVATYLAHRGRYTEAEPFFLQAIELYEHMSEVDHARLAISLRGLANTYRLQGKYAEAEPLFVRAIHLQEQEGGPEHPEVGTSLYGLAALYGEQGKFEEAEALFLRTLAIYEHAFGTEHPKITLPLHGLGSVYREQGTYAQAERLSLRSLLIQEKTLAPDHPHLAAQLNNLATLYAEQGRYEETRPLFQRALSIREKALGPDHPDVATSLSNLATLYAVQEQYAEARPLFERAIAIFERSLGANHPQLAFALTNLGIVYKELGQYAEAEPLLIRAQQIREQALGPEHPQVAFPLQNLAETYYLQGNQSKAEPLFLRVLQIREKALGPEHPQVAFPLDNLAEIYIAQGKYTEATAFFQRALAIREKALGPEYPDTATSLAGLAELHLKQKEYTEARELAARALRICENAFGPAHHRTQSIRRRFSGLFERESPSVHTESNVHDH